MNFALLERAMPAVAGARRARDPAFIAGMARSCSAYPGRAHGALLQALVATALAGTPAAAEPIPEILVLASQLRDEALVRTPTSLTLLDAPTVEAASLQHFEELTGLVPNLNWSGEGSRARYFQIRGTGELEQYEGAPNPSVGFIVDDIDLSAIGAVATLFDTGRIEVLRGPQGTRYGANALAGLIYVQTKDPSTTPEALLEVTGGSDATRALGAVAGGAVAGSDTLAWRVAAQHYASDGFRHNDFSGRDDTYDRDELTLRAKLRWAPSESALLQLTTLHVDLDNGYDAFSVHNGFTTQSDRPGADAQRTSAAALRGELDLGSFARLISITGLARSDMDFSFDADWGNDAFWGLVYDFTQGFDRRRDTFNQELRLVSAPDGRLFGADWVLGVYGLTLDERNARQNRGEFCETRPCDGPAADSDVTSDYDAASLAVFGLLEIPLAERTHLALGLRREQRDADYDDLTVNRLFAPAAAPGCTLTGADTRTCRYTARDRMWGGELTLTHGFTEATQGWARIARGYKAGGFNASIAGFDVPPSDLQFDPESLWNYELGLRVMPAGSRLAASVNVFLQQRDDLQIKLPVQFLTGDPTAFAFFTDNAEEGRTAGAELEWTWAAAPSLTVGGSLGLLDTEIERFATAPLLEGRELAHAPHYTFALNAAWQGGEGWFTRLDLTGKDRFTFDYCQADDCNDPTSRSFRRVDLRAGREWGPWRVELWARNLFDEEYAVRGFFFGNEPPNFAEKLYVRLGDPRHVGITVNYRL